MTRAPDPALATLYRLAGAPALALRRLRAPEEALARFAPDLAALDLCREDAAAALLAWPAVAAQLQPAIDRLGMAVGALPHPPAARPSRETAAAEPHRIGQRRPSHPALREADRRRIVDLLETYAAGRPGEAAHAAPPAARAGAERRRLASSDERRPSRDRAAPLGDAPLGRRVREAPTPAEARNRLRRTAERSGAPEAAHRVVAITGAGGTAEAARRVAAALTIADAGTARQTAVAPAGAVSTPASRPALATGDPVVARLVAALGALEASHARRQPAQSGPDDPATHRAEVGETVGEPRDPARATLAPAPSDRPRAAAVPSVGLRGLAERPAAPAPRPDEPARPHDNGAAPIPQPTRETLTRHIADILRHEARRHGIDVDEAGP